MRVKPVGSIGFRLRDLAGSTPPNHYPFQYKKDGTPVFRVGQIWVDPSTDELWEIVSGVSAVIHKETAASASLKLRLYGGFWSRERAILVAEIEDHLWPLERAIGIRQGIHSELQRIYTSGQINKDQFPDFSSFARAFGIDPTTGFRIN